MSIKRIYYYNGILESEVFEINGLMEGQYKSYYSSNIGENIKPKLFCNYVNGIKNGEEIEYYDNGQIATICYYNNGDLYGKLTKYYYDGILEKEEYYENNCKEGECRYYNEKGLLDEVIYYINDNMDGYNYPSTCG